MWKRFQLGCLVEQRGSLGVVYALTNGGVVKVVISQNNVETLSNRYKLFLHFTAFCAYNSVVPSAHLVSFLCHNIALLNINQGDLPYTRLVQNIRLFKNFFLRNIAFFPLFFAANTQLKQGEDVRFSGSQSLQQIRGRKQMKILFKANILQQTAVSLSGMWFSVVFLIKIHVS